MGMIEDLLRALDRVPLWKRLGDIPVEVDDLKRRVGAVEEKLGHKWPPDVCKSCGARALRMTKSTADREVWTCAACNNVEFRRP